MKNVLVGSYLVILASIILMILDLPGLVYNDLKFSNFTGILSNILLIFAMLLTIRNIKKEQKK
jgi:predicted ferric reductase